MHAVLFDDYRLTVDFERKKEKKENKASDITASFGNLRLAQDRHIIYHHVNATASTTENISPLPLPSSQPHPSSEPYGSRHAALAVVVVHCFLAVDSNTYGSLDSVPARHPAGSAVVRFLRPPQAALFQDNPLRQLHRARACRTMPPGGRCVEPEDVVCTAADSPTTRAPAVFVCAQVLWRANRANAVDVCGACRSFHAFRETFGPYKHGQPGRCGYWRRPGRPSSCS